MNLLLVLSIFGCVLFSTISGLSDEGRLVKHLIENNERMGGTLVRPVLHPGDTLTITHSLTLQNIQLDIANARMTAVTWAFLSWKDEGMKWAPRDFGGVDTVRVPSYRIFLPDIALYNAESPAQSISETKAIISSEGTVTWVPPVKTFTFCAMPKKVSKGTEVTCVIRYGSWTYDGDLMDIELSEDEATIEGRKVTADGEWEIVEAPLERHETKYECCEEKYVDITVSVKLRKN